MNSTGVPNSFNIIRQHWSGQFRSVQNGGNSTIERKVCFRKGIWSNGTKISSAWNPDCSSDFINSWSGKKNLFYFTQMVEANFHWQTLLYHRRNGWYRSKGKRRNRIWHLAMGCKNGRRNDKRCFYSQQQLRKSCKCCTLSVRRTIFFLRRGSMAVEYDLPIYCKHLSS